jgi:simple sugar transport system ATP-binding protein
VSLELRGITKTFGSFTANDSIDLKVETGQIHAILGENGAGKSTLMNIVYGLLKADSGEILIDGKVVDISNPSDALNVGIGMVHQHFMLIPVFTVAENIMLGHEKSNRFRVLNLDQARAAIRAISEDFGLQVDPDAIVETLPVGI